MLAYPLAAAPNLSLDINPFIVAITFTVYIGTHHLTSEIDHWQDMKVALHLNTQVFLAVRAVH